MSVRQKVHANVCTEHMIRIRCAPCLTCTNCRLGNFLTSACVLRIFKTYKSNTNQVILIMLCINGVNNSAPIVYGSLCMLSKQFSKYFTLCKMIKAFITSFKSLTSKSLYCLIHRNVSNGVLSQIHFTDSEYLYWFSRYEQSCELLYL